MAPSVLLPITCRRRKRLHIKLSTVAPADPGGPPPESAGRAALTHLRLVADHLGIGRLSRSVAGIEITSEISTSEILNHIGNINPPPSCCRSPGAVGTFAYSCLISPLFNNIVIFQLLLLSEGNSMEGGREGGEGGRGGKSKREMDSESERERERGRWVRR